MENTTIAELFFSTIKSFTLNPAGQAILKNELFSSEMHTRVIKLALQEHTHAGKENIEGFRKLLEEADIGYAEADKAAELPSTLEWHEGKWEGD